MAKRVSGLVAGVPPELRELLRSRSLRLQRPVWGRRIGRHRSVRAGAGLDFRDHRAYSPGDDPRLLDWRAVARRERLVLRQSEAEDELSLVMVLDTGGGMAYGEPPGHKLATARALLTGLAWLAARQGDPVGLATGGDGAVELGLTRPRSSPEQLAALAAALREARPRGVCPWWRLLSALPQRLPRRTLMVVASDFLDPGGGGDEDPQADLELTRSLASIRARRHDVVLLQVLHPDEIEFPWTNRTTLQFTDLRGVREPRAGSAAALRREYLQAFEAHQRRLRDRCTGEGLLLHAVRTGDDLGHAFLGLLARFDGASTPVAGTPPRVS